MNEEQIKSYYERIEKLLNGSNKITYGFVPEEIRQILKWYEKLQQENQQLKKDAEFEKTYARSLRKIIYKLYMDIGLSTGEFATLRQAIEENEVTND